MSTNTAQKKIAVLGSTGSIGRQTLEVCEHLGYSVPLLTGHGNDKLLEEQCRRFRPQTAWISEEKFSSLKARLADTTVRVVTGKDTLNQLAEGTQCDILLNSLLGIAGLEPTLAAIRGGQTIALANKETLVAGGSLVMSAAKARGTRILPVDSEHSAIFQSLHGQKAKKILLTASGGAFYGKKAAELVSVTPEQALRHPNWTMGAKITVDCATLMNKGLELIEAVWLFDVAPTQVEVLVHRQSVVHSAAMLADNTVIAQLARPDMRLCIQYALTYPERVPSLTEELDLFTAGSLTFEKPDEETFRLLPLARKAIERGGNIPAAMNGANEAAVQKFLQGKLSFPGITEEVIRATESCAFCAQPSLEDILATDQTARRCIG